MIKLTRSLGLILVCLVFVACSSTVMDGSWSNPEYKGQIKAVYILGVSKDALHQRIFEDTFGRELSSQGIKTVSSYHSLKRGQETKKDLIQQAMVSSGCDSILMTKLTGKRTEKVTTPGYVAGGYSPGYGGRGFYGGGWGDYYDRSYDVSYMPPTTTEFVVLTIESVLYDIKTDEMIWSAQLETVVEGDIDTMVEDFAETVIKDLKGKSLI